MNKKIVLPSRKVAQLIEVPSLDKVNAEYLKKIDVSDIERYVCIAYVTKEVKAFAMAVKTELSKKEVVDELRQDLEFQVNVLKQL